MAKKWAGGAWKGAKEGALTKKGWPNIGKLVSHVASNPKDYGTTIRELLLIANGSGDPSTKAKAKAAIKRLQASRPKKQE